MHNVAYSASSKVVQPCGMLEARQTDARTRPVRCPALLSITGSASLACCGSWFSCNHKGGHARYAVDAAAGPMTGRYAVGDAAPCSIATAMREL